jgi:hypothetical protein
MRLGHKEEVYEDMKRWSKKGSMEGVVQRQLVAPERSQGAGA